MLLGLKFIVHYGAVRKIQGGERRCVSGFAGISAGCNGHRPVTEVREATDTHKFTMQFQALMLAEDFKAKFSFPIKSRIFLQISLSAT
jgi:hypothetical protein